MCIMGDWFRVAVPSDEFPRMTEAEYLAFEAETEIRHEFRRGRVYAMTGGSVRHAIIAMNVGTEFNELPEIGCALALAQGYQKVTLRYV